jgi:hypothetical protein
VLFRVVQNGSSVSLIAVNAQMAFDTVGAPAASAAPASAVQPHTYKLDGANPKAGKAKIKIKIDVDPAIAGIDGDNSPLTKGLVAANVMASFDVAKDGKSFTMTIPSGLDFGDYTLTPAVKATAGDTGKPSGFLTFHVDAH